MNAPSFNIARNWWGKIIGAVLGLFRGGISGALIGAVIGHVIDRIIASIAGVGNTQQAFFRALFSTLGHLSKADGRVTENEIRAAENLMQRMQISKEERQRAIRYFNEGKSIGYRLDDALEPFVRHSVVRPDLRQMFMKSWWMPHLPTANSPMRNRKCCSASPRICASRVIFSPPCCRLGNSATLNPGQGPDPAADGPG
jgi:hypothetical protein